MNKRGIAMQTLVIAILSLIVLIILIFVFKGQIGSLMGQYTSVANRSETTAAGDMCGGLFTSTKCVDGACPEGYEIDSSLKCDPDTKSCCKKS